MIDMAKKDKEDMRTVELDRVFTFHGRHIGPGEVELSEEDADMIEGQMERAKARDVEVRRGDRATTTIRRKVKQGTDRMLDQVSREETDEPTFGDNDLPASALFGKTDEELEEEGLSEKQIKKLRKLEEKAEEEPTPKKKKSKKSKKSRKSEDNEDTVEAPADEEEQTESDE